MQDGRRKQRGSFDAFHKQLKNIAHQRQMKKDAITTVEAASTSSSATQLFSIEDIPYNGTNNSQFDPSAPSRSSDTKQPIRWGERQQQQQQQQEELSVVSVGFDSWDPPRGHRASSSTTQQQPQRQQRQQAHNGWLESPSPRRGSAAAVAATATAVMAQNNNHYHHKHQQQQQQTPTTPPEQPSSTRVKMIEPDRFQDWQLEAAQLWTHGIDLSMEEKPSSTSKKKKSGWLTFEEVAAYPTTHVSTPPPQLPQPPQQSQPLKSHHHQQRQTAPAPKVPTPPPQAPAAFITKLVSNLHTPQTVLLFLDAIEAGVIPYPPLIKALPNLISSPMQNRAVEKLLTIVVRAPSDFQQQLIHIIHASNPSTLFRHYLPSYLCLPRDVTLILDFFLALFTHSSPSSPLLQVVESHYTIHLKPTFLPQTCKEMDNRLKKLHALQSSIDGPGGSSVGGGGWGWPVQQQPDPEKQQQQQQQQAYFKHQLTVHQQHMHDIKNKKVGVVLKNVQWHQRATVLSPMISDYAHVYLAKHSTSFLDRHLLGCVAILISRSTQTPIFGTTIQVAPLLPQHDDDDDHPWLVAIQHHHHLPSSEQIDFDELILTTVPAFTLFPISDWLQHAAMTQLDINASLGAAMSLWSPSSSNDVPSYLTHLSLDVSVIMAPTYRGCKANISDDSWPVLQSKHLRLPVSQRPPLYTLSNSQIQHLQYAMGHRYSVTTGNPGTGKTYVASKCLALVYQALKQLPGRPMVLVVSDTAQQLTQLIKDAGPHIMQAATAWDNNLIMGTTTLAKGTSEWKQYRQLSRDLESALAKLQTLQQHRHAVVDQQQSQYVMELAPPSYRSQLNSTWLLTASQNGDDHSFLSMMQPLVDAILNPTSTDGRLVSHDDFVQQLEWMHDHPPPFISLSSSSNNNNTWPFHDNNNNNNNSDQARYALFKVWTQVDPNDLWTLSMDARHQLYAQVVKAYDPFLRLAIQQQQDQITKVGAALHQLRTSFAQTSVCRRHTQRDVGVMTMTTATAMAQVDLVRALCPQVMILDTAFGAVIEPLVLAQKQETQHVMVFQPLGDNEGGLEEQWRMPSDVYHLWRTASHVQHEQKQQPVFITKDSKSLGVKYNTYCVALDEDDHHKVVTWLAHLARYLYQQQQAQDHQQQQQQQDISVLVLVSSGQWVAPVKQALQQLVGGPTGAGGWIEHVHVDSVASYQHTMTEVETVLVGVLDAQGPQAAWSMALSRATSAMYIVGARETLAEHAMWQRVLTFMESQGRCWNAIPLVCQQHPQTETLVQHVDDFANVQNGGCNAICNTLKECGHVCQEMCHHQPHETMPCQQPCDRPRPPGCMHRCKQPCHACQRACLPCEEPMTIELNCGHTLPNVPCHFQHLNDVECPELVTETLISCGHTVTGPCGRLPPCTSLCLALLPCGHPCQQKCGVEHDHDRSSCTLECPKQLICGHHCAKGCANPDDHTQRCLKACDRLCSHGYRCARRCWEVCVKCKSPCPYQCPHSQCSKKCYEICDREPCNEPCPKRLSCTHPCRGVCGEPCTKCIICHPKEQCLITLRSLSEFTTEELIYTLPECGCSFSLEGLDSYFSSRVKNGEHTAIKQWVCPSCQAPILTAGRYANQIRSEFTLIDTIKQQQEADLQSLTSEERFHIINAMNEEPNNHINDIVGGRWFVCKNQHPYFIGDCGGATEVSTCPQCNEAIGGLQHQVLDTNRFYGEFDGSAEPAWPGQPRS
ncbi:hypothetical protein BCR42DRAFT_427349 [Absidia repens]|uniref:RZ-type domain-containing protein n=1 Tax=Absidia repens TaxID=90262 RepID=A0A1X2HZT5_9FUNG|nr:hypothetical protein BCR42DRAFT_427349 [Absidia repens]